MEKKIKQLLKIIKLNENTISMVFGVITMLLVGTIVVRMFDIKKPEITKQAEQVVETSPTTTLNNVTVQEKEDGEIYVANQKESYTVQKGDHLWKIATTVYGSGYNWVDIAKENGIKNPSQIFAGQELKLPKVAVKLTNSQKAEMKENVVATNRIEGDSYTVSKGDTLWSISVRAYADGYRYPEIAKANNLTNANIIEVGQKLQIPR